MGIDLDKYDKRVKPGTPLASFASWAVVAPVPALYVALGIVLEELGERAAPEDAGKDVRNVVERIRSYRKARDVDEDTEREIEVLAALVDDLLARWPEVAERLDD